MAYSDDQPRDDNGRWAAYGGDTENHETLKSTFKQGMHVRDRFGSVKQVVGINQHGQVVAGKFHGDAVTDVSQYHPTKLSIKVGSRVPVSGPQTTKGNKRVAMQKKY